MCLRAQGIDDNTGVVGRVRRSHGISDDNGGVRRGRGTDDAYKVSDTTMEATKIRGRRQRLRRHGDGPNELATTTEASEEEDDPEVLTTTTDISAEEA